MDVERPLALLAGLSPAQFMRRHWQKKPLLVRAAIPGLKPVLSRAELFALAAQPQVESRLVQQQASGWRMKQGPFGPRSLPALARPGWTLLVQGVDLHHRPAHDLLQQFRFVPDARLDDLMISFATSGGGVGPHFDSYDVFLLQASGRRRWKIGRQKDLSLQQGVPLKILQNFEPEQEFLLEAGDMLYLPPRYAHDGLAEACTGGDGKPADCMTYSIGFQAPEQGGLAGQLLQRLADFADDRQQGEGARRLYRDPSQPAVSTPAAVPGSLIGFAQDAVQAALKDPLALACVLGEYLTEPKASLWFDTPSDAWNPRGTGGLCLDPRSRMMYDGHHVFINGESYRAKGADARLMRRLADQRRLTLADLRGASPDALDLLSDWHANGWVLTAQPLV
ncbi:MAG: cupin domain-containing protein [Polaromonas sp.]|nr:cupin domain-containing protein [Polaromonas sp.]MDP3750389.1 cupin domain-containing protein [Polaromonas sp.]